MTPLVFPCLCRLCRWIQTCYWQIRGTVELGGGGNLCSWEFRWAIGAEPYAPLSLALPPSSDSEHEEQAGAPFSQLPIKKEAFLKPPDTAPSYFLPPHPPDTHSREGVNFHVSASFTYICPLLPFGKCLPRETRRCPHGTWRHAWRLRSLQEGIYWMDESKRRRPWKSHATFRWWLCASKLMSTVCVSAPPVDSSFIQEDLGLSRVGSTCVRSAQN